MKIMPEIRDYSNLQISIFLGVFTNMWHATDNENLTPTPSPSPAAGEGLGVGVFTEESCDA
jgi:hypothetical protein